MRSLLWGISVIFCSITALELILGSLGILKSLNLFIGSLTISLLSVIYLRLNPLKPSETDRQTDTILSLNKQGILAVLLIATVFSISLQSWIIEYFFQIHRVHPLISWDVVTYHLPNAIDYLQTGSLWTMKGSFSQYPGGNELINIWSFLPLKNDSMLGINSLALTSIIILVLVQFLQDLKIFKCSFYYAISYISIIIFLLIQSDFQRAIYAFGQNDLSLACIEILALWIFLECQRSPVLSRNWIVLGSLLGIGVGIKPNGFYYFIGFLILICMEAFLKRSLSSQAGVFQLLKRLGLVSSFTLLLGGFWYIRNIIKLSSVFESSILKAGFPGSIVNNLFNPNLYVLDDTNLTIILICFINLFGLIVLFVDSRVDRSTFASLIGFNFIAFMSFIFTPHSSGFWAGGQWIFKTQLRYGLTLIPVTAVVAVVLIFKISQSILLIMPSRLQRQAKSWISLLHRRSASTQIKVTPRHTIIILSLLCLIQVITYLPPNGLPNFEAILFVRNAESPLSQVYQWIQQNVSDKTIYTIALRPYGLYNFPFSNRVIYPGDSDQFSYEQILESLTIEQVDYIAIARNPFNGNFPIALKDLIEDTRQFELVYGDLLAAVFRVN
ncbi:MAG: hypothetical protein ACO31I_01440 [Prochlorotrichaceae cyanobacterium]